jgi:hypothetical protein
MLESYSQCEATSMQMPEPELIQLLAEYGKDVRLVIQLLEERFGIPDAIRQWRSKFLGRVGFLDVEETVHYAMHGAGCTVEFADGKSVSFDLDESGSYYFDAWKFKRYTESMGVDCDSLDDHYIKSLVIHVFYHQ